MIVNVRGGSGAGKSTVIRAIMSRYPNRVPHFVEGRKQPLWYDLSGEGLPPLRVLGHYESECGGCDTISKNPGDENEKAMAFIFRLVREADDADLNVLFEGVILTTILGELPKLHAEARPIVVVNLTSDLETCLLGIADRRLRKEGAAPGFQGVRTVQAFREGLEEVTVKNNVGKLKSALKTAKQLEAVGITVYHEDRASAVPRILEVLSL
jgi:hypothetical protein